MILEVGYNQDTVDLNLSKGKYIFTSAEQHEGKSTILFKAAWGLAVKGNKVLVIDCDMRGSSRKGYSYGLGGYLNGRVTAKEAIIPPLPFYYVSCGSLHVFSLKHKLEEMKSLIEYGSFDYVLIDTPPLGLFTDAMDISGLADGIVLIKDVCRERCDRDGIALERIKNRSVVLEILNHTKIETPHITI